MEKPQEGYVVLSALPAERRQAVMVDILSRYANGDNLDALADEHGVSRPQSTYGCSVEPRIARMPTGDRCTYVAGYEGGSGVG